MNRSLTVYAMLTVPDPIQNRYDPSGGTASSSAYSKVLHFPEDPGAEHEGGQSLVLGGVTRDDDPMSLIDSSVCPPPLSSSFRYSLYCKGLRPPHNDL